MPNPDHDFQKFYYTKVGLGEGCGCAERVIDLHEADRKSAMPRTRALRHRLPLSTRLHHALAALGLTRRR
ncbi:hypothetical protein [Roseovarius indicus]|uniref:hypothetical protein n=1 Tax=Roseovarius indicus TaxID=540747 RepID=UPI0032EDEC12